MTFSTRNFEPLTPLAPKFPNFATQILLFRLKNTVAVVTRAHVLQKFYTTWVLRVACQKTTFRTEIGGGWARGASKKFGTPYIFLQLLKLATSNLVQKLGTNTTVHMCVALCSCEHIVDALSTQYINIYAVLIPRCTCVLHCVAVNTSWML